MGPICNQIAVREAIIVHARMSKFLLILMQLIHFRAYSRISTTSAHLSTENVTTLGCSSWLAAAVERIDAV